MVLQIASQFVLIIHMLKSSQNFQANIVILGMQKAIKYHAVTKKYTELQLYWI